MDTDKSMTQKETKSFINKQCFFFTEYGGFIDLNIFVKISAAFDKNIQHTTNAIIVRVHILTLDYDCTSEIREPVLFACALDGREVPI